MNKKNHIAATICACLAILGCSLFIIFLIGLLTIPFEVEGLIITLTTAVITILLIISSFILSKGYKIKYLFLGKDFKRQLELSLNKFNISDETFLKKFIKKRKQIYRQTGHIYYKDTDTYLYRDNKFIEKILNLYKLLLNCIETKGGFVEFCNSLDFEKYESGWNVNYLMTNNLISNELKYLITEVLILTDFYVFDNGLSEEFTETNNKNIELLNNIYSPALFNFKEEIISAIKKIEMALNCKNQ